MKIIRIYSPFDPFCNQAGGSEQVIAFQIQALQQLGYQIECISWKTANQKSSRLRNALERTLRVAHSLRTPYSSSELFYYPLHRQTFWNQGQPLHPSQLQRPVNLSIYHYSFAYPWLKQNPQSPNQKSVVVFHNLESELADLEAQNRCYTRWIHHANVKKLRQHEQELAQINLCNELWFISPEDQQRLNPHHPSRLISPGYLESFKQQRVQQRQQWLQGHPTQRLYPVLGLIGRLDFLPNQASLKWLIEHIAPSLQAVQFAGQLLIVGANLPHALKRALEPFPWIRYLGFLPDAENFWNQIDMMLVPHIQGSGVRIKLLEALACGIPSMTTPQAVQRIHPSLRNHPSLFISAEPQDWVKHLLSLPPSFQRSFFEKEPMPQALNLLETYRFLEYFL